MINRKTTYSSLLAAKEQSKKRGLPFFAHLFIAWRFALYFLLCFSTLSVPSVNYAQFDGSLGQIIQIQTRFHSFVGKPTWLLIIRDLDHGQNIPYLFEIKKGENTWIAFTHSRNYLILASNLQIETYKAQENRYAKYRIRNFCQLQSFGRINRGTSMSVMITGYLSPNTDTFRCQTSTYHEMNFSIPNMDS